MDKRLEFIRWVEDNADWIDGRVLEVAAEMKEVVLGEERERRKDRIREMQEAYKKSLSLRDYDSSFDEDDIYNM